MSTDSHSTCCWSEFDGVVGEIIGDLGKTSLVPLDHKTLPAVVSHRSFSDEQVAHNTSKHDMFCFGYRAHHSSGRNDQIAYNNRVLNNIIVYIYDVNRNLNELVDISAFGDC